jgi:hypothetical protein
MTEEKVKLTTEERKEPSTGRGSLRLTTITTGESWWQQRRGVKGRGRELSTER